MNRRNVASALPTAYDPSGEEARPLRRDAEVILGRILEAARDVFAEQGYDASMEAIATRADVGVGTLYRRFPTKADLFSAVVEEARRRNREIAEEVLADVPPGRGRLRIRAALHRRAQRLARHHFRAAVGDEARDGPGADRPLLEQILQRSMDAGTLRPEVEVTDVVVVLKAVRSIADLCDMPAQKPSLRFLELALDGLRPGHAAPAHPPLTMAQLAKLLDQR